MFTDLQNHFIVSNWDQRGAGKTAEMNEQVSPPSFETMTEDTQLMVDFLLQQFNKKRIYLAGHSWGTVLGFEMAKVYPGKLHAFIAISPIIDELQSQKIAIDHLIDYFDKKGNDKAVNELKNINPPASTLNNKINLYR